MLISHSWAYLLVAIFFGALGTISMKLSDGLEKLQPTLFLIIFYFISFIALTLAAKSMDISIVYALWSGIGTVFVAIVGILIFKESMSIVKIISLFLIILGVIGIHLTNGSH